MKTFLLLAALAMPQDLEPTPVADNLEQNVRDIAGLVVTNTDELAAIRARVEAIEVGVSKIDGMYARIEALENKVFEIVPDPIVHPAPPVTVTQTTVDVCPDEVVLSTTPVVITTTPTYLYSSPIVRIEPSRVVYPRTVVRNGGRTSRTPLRNFLSLRWLRGRRMTTQPMSRSAQWSWPGGIDSHLTGPPHFVSASYVNSLGRNQKIQLHNSLHNGG